MFVKLPEAAIFSIGFAAFLTNNILAAIICLGLLLVLLFYKRKHGQPALQDEISGILSRRGMWMTAAEMYVEVGKERYKQRYGHDAPDGKSSIHAGASWSTVLDTMHRMEDAGTLISRKCTRPKDPKEFVSPWSEEFQRDLVPLEFSLSSRGRTISRTRHANAQTTRGAWE